VFVWVEALPGKFVFGIAFAQAGEEAGEGSGGDCKRGRDGIVGFSIASLVVVVRNAGRC
jgi:hypothetical protein